MSVSTPDCSSRDGLLRHSPGITQRLFWGGRGVQNRISMVGDGILVHPGAEGGRIGCAGGSTQRVACSLLVRWIYGERGAAILRSTPLSKENKGCRCLSSLGLIWCTVLARSCTHSTYPPTHPRIRSFRYERTQNPHSSSFFNMTWTSARTLLQSPTAPRAHARTHRKHVCLHDSRKYAWSSLGTVFRACTLISRHT